MSNNKPHLSKLFFLILIAAIFLVVSLGLVLFQPGAKSSASNQKGFAIYQEVPVKVKPKVPAYTVKPDLSNIINRADLDDDYISNLVQTKSLLAKNGFAVVPAFNQEFFSIYETNRYNYFPSFVTTDSVLHNYHLIFNYLLKKLEEEKLSPELKTLTNSLLAVSLKQYNSLKGTSWENAAKRTVGFFAVAAKLLDPQTPSPRIVQAEVKKELALIKAHNGIQTSPVINIGEPADMVIDTPMGPQSLEAFKEDYSQYIPRGHYDKTEILKAYFKATMWYGRATFRLKNEDEIRSALIITLALQEKDNQTIWAKISQPVDFFVGQSDDITCAQFQTLAEQVYGPKATLAEVSRDQEKFEAFMAAAKKLEPPQINSIPIFQASIQPNREREIKGFRFMGQRFTIDASIFQRLVDREVPKRMLPRGLDIPAALGSAEAADILQQAGETKYENYSANLNKLKKYLAGLGTDCWTQNLYWGWLYSLQPLTQAKPAGYPSFMTNSAWTRKDLNTYLGSWTELKHDTILYAKQVYAEMGGAPPELKDDRGYVEPEPYLYARLASLLKMTSDGLKNLGWLSEKRQALLKTLRQMALSFKTISEKELSNAPLTADEYELIRSYGGQLEHFWLEVNQEEMDALGVDQRSFLDQNPAALVADVATDPNGQVLEEGTGQIFLIYVVVPVGGKLRIAKGGVFSHYEFAWPLDDRLTDNAWRKLLDSPKAPALPDWTKSFTVKSE